MSITYRQADDILFATYGVDWSWDDYEWHRDMIEWMQEYPSVKALRKEHPEFVVPKWWPGA